MSFASDLFSGLTGFRDHLAASVLEEAKPVLAAVEAHLARLEPLVRGNILAAEEEGKAILHELYGSLVKDVQTAVSAPAVAPVAEPTPQPAPEAAVPVAVDPTPAPSTTEASSAPSSTSSASTTEPAAPAAPAA